MASGLSTGPSGTAWPARAVGLLLAALLAGCVGGGNDDLDGGSPLGNDTGASPTGAAEPEPEEEPTPPPPQDLYNQSIQFPRTPLDAPGRGEFEVPQDAWTLRIRIKPMPECTGLGYYNNAGLVITPPTGDPIARNFFGTGTGTVGCTTEYSAENLIPEALPGPWRMETTGQFTGRLDIAVTANPQ